MAVLGLTMLAAVNRLLRSVNVLPVSALDTGGSSMQARAESVLQETNINIQSRGLNSNTVRARDYTPVSNEIQVASSVLMVRSAGKDQHRTLTLRGDKVYDLDGDTATFNAAVCLDVVKLVAFEDLPPADKEHIANEATIEFQRVWRGSPDQDAFRRDNAAKTAPFVRTDGERNSLGPVNPYPMSAFSQRDAQTGGRQQ